MKLDQEFKPVKYPPLKEHSQNIFITKLKQNPRPITSFQCFNDEVPLTPTKNEGPAVKYT
jgi:hypothetical protein